MKNDARCSMSPQMVKMFIAASALARRTLSLPAPEVRAASEMGEAPRVLGIGPWRVQGGGRRGALRRRAASARGADLVASSSRPRGKGDVGLSDPLSTHTGS